MEVLSSLPRARTCAHAHISVLVVCLCAHACLCACALYAHTLCVLKVSSTEAAAGPCQEASKALPGSLQACLWTKSLSGRLPACLPACLPVVLPSLRAHLAHLLACWLG